MTDRTRDPAGVPDDAPSQHSGDFVGPLVEADDALRALLQERGVASFLDLPADVREAFARRVHEISELKAPELGLERREAREAE